MNRTLINTQLGASPVTLLGTAHVSRASAEEVSQLIASNKYDVVKVKAPIFLWNVFPLHPFEKGDPLSNRAHNARERKAGTDILVKIVDYIKPHRIIAIGNDAFNVLSTAFTSNQVYKVRHPSYGGQSEFLSAMSKLYDGYIVETGFTLH